MKKPGYTPRSAWETCTDPTEHEALEALASRYLDFISQCKTERETIAHVRERLLQAGYVEDFSPAAPCLFRQLRGKALFAVRRGTAPLERGLSLIAAHADSPRLDFKQRPLIEQPGVAQAKTHYYGGIRKYQWLARPLALHGVVVRDNGECVQVTVGENPDEPVFCIADLLPHLAQKQSQQPLGDAFEGEKLNIILAHRPKTGTADEQDVQDGDTASTADSTGKDAIKARLLDCLHQKYGIVEEDLISAELQAVPAGPARFVGFDKALLGGYGQDDRICVFTALEALLSARPGAGHMALMLWDKEEIGSDGASGASSRFFQYCVEDLARAWAAEIPASRILQNSRAISADVHAAFDPDFPEVHEKQNAAQLGFGPCFAKYGGSRGKYSASEADAEYFAWLRGIFNARNIPWQAAELGKVDQGGGGTVALFLAAYGMQVIDLGPALLSMHSPFELASSVDLHATLQAYRAFLEA